MDEQFRQRIEFLVTKVGGQSALARATNMSLGAVQRYLKGGDPTRLALIRLAKAGNVSMNWLIFGEEGAVSDDVTTCPAKLKLYGFDEESRTSWQVPFQYRIRTDLEWPDPTCFAIVAGNHALSSYGVQKGFSCYVSPNTRPQEDDIVYVKKMSGEAALCVYARQDSQYVYVHIGTCEKNGEKPLMKEETLAQSDLDMIAPVIFVKRR